MKTWKTQARRCLLVLVTSYIVLLMVLWCVQDRLLYPKPGPLVPWGALQVQRPDGLLRGWVTRPDAQGALVVFGGNAMRVAGVGDAWQPCTDVAIYAMPYRGYEGQRGTPREADIVADGVALVEQVMRHHPRVAIVGISLGSGVAVQVAARTHPERLLLVTPYDRLDQVAQDHLPWIPARWLIRDHYNSLAHVDGLRDVSVSLLQADRDAVIAAARTRALAAAIPGGLVAWNHANTTHNGVWSTPQMCDFLRTQTAGLNSNPALVDTHLRLR